MNVGTAVSFSLHLRLELVYTLHNGTAKQRAQFERLGYAARLRDAPVESLEQAGVSDALNAVESAAR
mgnify:CR=1